MFSDRIKLRTETVSLDDAGYKSYSYHDAEVWANKKSVTRSEFYAANQSGILITQVFEVHPEDYGGQKIILYNGNQYRVVRAYQIGNGRIELNCSDYNG